MCLLAVFVIADFYKQPTSMVFCYSFDKTGTEIYKMSKRACNHGVFRFKNEIMSIDDQTIFGCSSTVQTNENNETIYKIVLYI